MYNPFLVAILSAFAFSLHPLHSISEISYMQNRQMLWLMFIRSSRRMYLSDEKF